MKSWIKTLCLTLSLCFLVACASAYKAKPLPFKAAATYPNATEKAGAIVGARAFVDPKEAKEAFGFDIRAAGMLPVQVVFDHKGAHPLKINAGQTFLEDQEGNLWPVLARDVAYERATKYTQTKEVFKKGAQHAFLGAAAGALIGAAVGVVGGGDIAGATGKGAAAGAAAGGLVGGVKGYGSKEARRSIIDDLKNKSLESKPVDPNSIAFGFIFFPGEARTAKQLRLQLLEADTGASHVLELGF